MAEASPQLIAVLRQTAKRLSRVSVKYQWGSFAHCNCGHLAQTVTGLAPDAIEARGARGDGDWTTQAAQSTEAARPRPDFDYGDRPALDEGAWEPFNVGACQVTGAPLDDVFAELYGLGLTASDIGSLERLSDAAVRRRLGTSTKKFAHHDRDNVVAYLDAWADLLEDQLHAAAETAQWDRFLDAAE